jgi:hypothetical protein
VRFGRGITTPNSPANAIDHRSDLSASRQDLGLDEPPPRPRASPRFCCKSVGLAIGQAWDGKFYCCAILDRFSRMIVPRHVVHYTRYRIGYNAVKLAVVSRNRSGATILHADHALGIHRFSPSARTTTARNDGDR